MNGMILLLFLGTMGLSLWATFRVKSVYQRYHQGGTLSGLTGAQTAQRILAAAGIRDVSVVAGEGLLSDHYDPVHRRLVLSPDNYHGVSPAALGVAAHEAGHALQHQAAYAPLQWRMSAVGAATIANQVVLWLPLLGLFTGFIQAPLAMAIVAVGWCVLMLFNLVTLPVEFDASRRAKACLSGMGIIRTPEESDAVNRVLNAAAFTYVAAFLTTLVYFLWHLAPFLLGRSDD